MQPRGSPCPTAAQGNSAHPHSASGSALGAPERHQLELQPGLFRSVYRTRELVAGRLAPLNVAARVGQSPARPKR